MTTSDIFICRQTVSYRTFEQLYVLWRQVAASEFQTGLMTEAILSRGDYPSQLAEKRERFSILKTSNFYALLLGKPISEGAFYKICISFDRATINRIWVELQSSYPHNSALSNALKSVNHPSVSTPINLQNHLLLKIMEILLPQEENLDNHSPQFPICQPVEAALYQQVEQEKLLNQVITQIRQSLELPIVLETAVREVRNLLQVDRLLIYQFLDESFNDVQSSYGRGRIIYESRISESIPSLLNLEAEDNCFTYITHYQEKYRRGLIVAVEDVEQAYSSSFCLAEFLRQHQVRSKLIAPIVVQDELWGLVIAHQCYQKRQWQEHEKKFLGHIGEHLSIAIYQAQLYAQVQQQKNLFEQRVIERTQELQDTLIAAECANLSKSEFLSNISHELLTPLTCIIGLSNTLQRSSSTPALLTPEKQKQYLKIIEDNGHKLLDLINDILNFSLFSAGKASLDIQEFSLKTLCDQIIKSIQTQAQHKQIDIELELRFTNPEISFCADPERLQQLLLQLLKNAIKFTPEKGRVTLRVWRESDRAIFQIEDTGIGIAEQQIPLLFETFKQLENSRKRTYGGIGLGLALTKQLVELHRGTIEVESVLDRGSLFTVRIPNQSYRHNPESLATSINDPAKNSEGTVVLLEDNEEEANQICKLLTTANYQVIWLAELYSSAQKIKIIEPSVVILDEKIPDIYHLSVTLKHSRKTQAIKTLLLKDSPLPPKEKFLLKNGIDDYLTKPIQPTALLEKIRYLISLFHSPKKDRINPEIS